MKTVLPLNLLTDVNRNKAEELCNLGANLTNILYYNINILKYK